MCVLPLNWPLLGSNPQWLSGGVNGGQWGYDCCHVAGVRQYKGCVTHSRLLSDTVVFDL